MAARIKVLNINHPDLAVETVGLVISDRLTEIVDKARSIGIDLDDPYEVWELLNIRPLAKVFIRSFHTNHFKDYLLIIKDWLNTLTNIGSVDRSRTFARGLLMQLSLSKIFKDNTIG